jgi:ABC-type Mn2+/Zn2+ transport system ATPase subunit
VLNGDTCVAVAVRDVSVRYGDAVALDGTTAEARRGCLVCLVGRNGAGKSTLLKAIVGMASARGEIRVLGVRDRSRRRLIAYVPQREEVNWRFPVSVLEVVLMGRSSSLRRVGWNSRRDVADATRALEDVGMADLRARSIGDLSGGQQQRVILARALFSTAPVLLLDEPLAGIDAGSGEVTMRLLRHHCVCGGTVLMATHDLVGASRIGDRVWGIDRTVVDDVPAAHLMREEVLRRIYGTSA